MIKYKLFTRLFLTSEKLVHRFIFSKIIFTNIRNRRLILYLIDSLLIYISLLSLDIFLSEGELNPSNYFSSLDKSIIIILGIFLFRITGQYNGLTRSANSQSIYQIFIRSFLLSSFCLVLNKFGNLYQMNFYSFLLLNILISSYLSISRITLRDILSRYTHIFLKDRNFNNKNKKNVLIYGAGEAGLSLSNSLKTSSNLNVFGFLDDSSYLWGRNIQGIPIYNPKDLKKFINKIDQILIAIPSLRQKRSVEILKSLEKFSVSVLKIPSIDQLTSSNISIDSLNPIDVYDLLQREPIKPFDKLMSSVKGKVVCITGAGGSIGSELSRQILFQRPKVLILIEISEPALWTIHQELMTISQPEITIFPVLADVSNHLQMIQVFKEKNVDIVFHSAAYKHVPLVENNPLSGIKNNIIGTKSLCLAASECNVKQFILISTDKAVRPTSVMGASKRFAELIVQSFAKKEKYKEKNKTIFSMVRFGNVLGSSGSVVPLFIKQIKSGGPVTLTHNDVIRYFMTIDEAAQLVIQTASLAEGGDVFLLDMGEPVLIKTLAYQMIRLSGLKVKDKDNFDGDIEIKTTGLRPGEKLYEETLIENHSTKTSHPLILRALEKSIKYSDIFPLIELLEKHLKENDEYSVMTILKKVVPEWNTKRILN